MACGRRSKIHLTLQLAWPDLPALCVAYGQGCRIEGKPYASDSAQLAGWRAQNDVTEPEKHIGVPPEDGAFEFVPNRYTRKQ